MSPERRTELARLIAAQVCLHACMTGLRMAVPLMALRAGHSAAAVGMLLALFALSQVFLALPAGRFADRHGLHRPMRFAIGLSTGAGAMAALFPLFPVLCLSALCSGAATGLAMIALQRHVGRTARDAAELRQVFSWLAIGPSISNFLGPFAAGLMIDASGFRAAYLLLALFPSLAWLWLRRTRPLPPLDATVRPEGQTSWDLLRDAGFRRLLLINWLLSSCWDVHTFLVPVLGHERSLSATAIGAVLGAFALAATAIRMLMPWLTKNVRESVVIGSAMLATAVLFALYPFAQSALAMGLLSVLLGVALGSVQPMIMSLLHQMTPKARHGEALGLRAMAINASSVVMPMLFGTTGALVGVSGVFWAVGLGVAAGAPLVRRMRAQTAPDGHRQTGEPGSPD